MRFVGEHNDLLLSCDLEDFPVSITDGKLLVELWNAEEGICGDYDESDPDDVNLLRSKEKSMKIIFDTEMGYNTMYSEDGRMYAEIELPHDTIDYNGERVPSVSEDYGYFVLKAAILQLAADHGIPADILVFWYDGQEQYLSEDAHVKADVYAEFKGE